MITYERLIELLTFHPDTGKFVWNKSKGRKPAGSEAGAVVGRYISIKIDGRVYAAHRLAVLYMTGKFPTDIVDNINGDSYDNRWINLRECSQSENQHNRRPSRPGKTGTVKHHNKYKARIMSDNKSYYLGSFDTEEEAYAAYVEAKLRLHPTAPKAEY